MVRRAEAEEVVYQFIRGNMPFCILFFPEGGEKRRIFAFPVSRARERERAEAVREFEVRERGREVV